MKVLVSDPVDKVVGKMLEDVADVDFMTGLSPDELKALIGDYEGLIVRSETKVTSDIIAAAPRLMVIARAGAGVDNIDVEAATENGVLVVNAPSGNTISTAEHTFGMMLALARHIPQANASLRSGKWDRKSYMGAELYRKTLGIIGLGRVGAEVGKRAMAFGMDVIAYDPYASATVAGSLGISLVPLEELIERSDFVTVHAQKSPETAGLIGAEQIAKMRDGVRIINCARGGIVDESALLEALQSGKVAGAALDVYQKEPAVGNPLVELSNVVATPHLAASSREAQVNVAVITAEDVKSALRGQPVENAVNRPVNARCWPQV